MKQHREREREQERAEPAPAPRAAGLTEHLLRLQATAGNAAVARMLARVDDEEAELSDEERAALYYTALRVKPEAQPFEEIGGLFDEVEVEDPPTDNMALYYDTLRPPAVPKPKPQPEAFEDLEGISMFDEPQPKKKKTKGKRAPRESAPASVGYQSIFSIASEAQRAAPLTPPQPAKPAPAKPAAAKPAPAKPPPRAFESRLTEEQQGRVATEARRMMTTIANQLTQGRRGNLTIDVALPSEANYDVKHWLRENYEEERAPCDDAPQGSQIKYHIVTDAHQRTKIDITGHRWAGGRDRTQGGGGQNWFNFHVEWAQHW